MSRVYSYVIKHDTGFAPNPFWGFCTLATCKPAIRRVARKGDWVVGTGSVRNVGRQKLVYAMRVDDVLTFEEYDRDPRFRLKRPKMHGSARQRSGDNIYSMTADGQWSQRDSRHGSGNIERDLKGRHVLVSRDFRYWGLLAIPIPAEFIGIVQKGQGHRSRFSHDLVQRFTAWLRRHKIGVHGRPSQGESDKCDCREIQADRKVNGAKRRGGTS